MFSILKPYLRMPKQKSDDELLATHFQYNHCLLFDYYKDISYIDGVATLMYSPVLAPILNRFRNFLRKGCPSYLNLAHEDFCISPSAYYIPFSALDVIIK